MVSYCCVKDCRNNSAEKWKGSSGNITFHVFPTKPEARDRWLKAIGRPGWDPPNHARICSAHFSHEQINREHQRTRLKEDACPVQYLPDNSYLEASQMEVCQICLIFDVKMYSLQHEVLKKCMKSIIGLNKDIEGLPQYICYECASLLVKSYGLIEKSRIAKAILLNIYSENGEVTKSLISTINRTQMNLKSSLTYNNVIPKTIIDLHYDDDLKQYIYTSTTEENISINKEKQVNNNKITKRKSKTKHNDPKKKEMQSNDTSEFTLNLNNDLSKTLDDYKLDDNYFDNNIVPDNFVNISNDIKLDASDSEPDYTIDNEEQFDSKNENITDEPVKERKPRKKVKNNEGLTPDEIEMQKYYNIVTLTLEEQIEDREKMKISDAYRDALYKCDICYKTYLHPNAYKMHMESHEPSRGKAECPVCRLRYKNDVLARSHANRAHGKKFYCKTCPKFFYNVRIARTHQKRHEGYLYKCELCTFSTIHESAYSSHVRQHQRMMGTEQTANEEVRDSQSMYRCDKCHASFTSDDALRVHLSTSEHCKEKTNTCTIDAAQWSCGECGVQFPTSALMRQHVAERHAAAAAAKRDSYPEPCAHCGEMMNNRKEHYFHIRKRHPKERSSYQPVITAVCDTCGKGFQNSTKLHLHELRHGGPGTVRCPHCPRLFYDKYQLARHVAVHSEARPHACSLCDKAFKLRSNLDRHAVVHSGATSYECTMCGKRFRYSSSRNLHVRSVHYKLPPPPRRKRNAKKTTLNNEQPCVQ